MAYADYEFYTDTYLGNVIAEADFPRLAARASEFIDRITFERAAPVVEANDDEATITKIGMATCAVAEIEQALAGSGGVVKSESIGRYSVTYANPESATAKKFAAARLYLAPTRLLFPGLTEEEQ